MSLRQLSPEESCRKTQRNRVKAVAQVLVDGLEHTESKVYIVQRMNQEDDFWQEGLEMSECPTDLEVDTAIQSMKLLVMKLVV